MDDERMLVKAVMVPCAVAAICLFFAMPSQAQDGADGFHDLKRWPAKVVEVDLERGTILGVPLGASEAETRETLTAAGIRDIDKVTYPGFFLLQSKDCLGVIFNFTKGWLSHVYSNSPQFQLPHGLRPGATIDDFREAFGSSISAKKLPSKVGESMVFQSGSYVLEVVRLYDKPDIGHAVTVRRGTKNR